MVLFDTFIILYFRFKFHDVLPDVPTNLFSSAVNVACSVLTLAISSSVIAGVVKGLVSVPHPPVETSNTAGLSVGRVEVMKMERHNFPLTIPSHCSSPMHIPVSSQNGTGPINV